MAASRSRSPYRYLAEAELRKSAASSRFRTFDVFLSHSAEDAEVIAGVKVLLEREGLSVYVDWLEDPQAERTRVTAATADMLRDRMNNSGFLLYASSRVSSNSKWMPWELGYFDGRKPGRVGILPVVDVPGRHFVGTEYLGLYPIIERLSFERVGRRFARYRDNFEADMLSTLARS